MRFIVIQEKSVFSMLILFEAVMMKVHVAAHQLLERVASDMYMVLIACVVCLGGGGGATAFESFRIMEEVCLLGCLVFSFEH